MRSTIIAFALAFALCAAGFLILDIVIMNLHGLSLIFEG